MEDNMEFASLLIRDCDVSINSLGIGGSQSMFPRLVSCCNSSNRSLVVDLALDYGVNVNKSKS